MSQNFAEVDRYVEITLALKYSSRLAVTYFPVYFKLFHVPYASRLLRAAEYRLWPWLVEFNGVVLSCFMLPLSIIFMAVSLISPED